MTYTVHEIFYSLQGEGFHAGRPAVFCRFAGCNLWSGREEDRAKATCRFCDTKFSGVNGQNGGEFKTAGLLASRLLSFWPKGAKEHPFLVLTGGEPLLQVGEELLYALHKEGFEVAAETNGTLPAPAGIDWLTVSPKAGTQLVQRRGDELKVIFPQAGLDLDAMGDLDFTYFFLQPMDGPDGDSALDSALATCLEHPRWRLSLQIHKLLRID